MPTPPIRIPFPIKGLNLTAGYRDQPAGTSHDLLNVRPFDAIEGRMRGGRRPGLSKWLDDPISGQPIQFMAPVVKAAAYATATEEYTNEVVVAGYDLSTNHRVRLYSYSDGSLLDTLDFSNTPAAFGLLDSTSDSDGNIYLATYGPTDTYPESDGTKASLWKLNPSGEVVWHYNLSGSTYQNLCRITYDPIYNRVLVGGVDEDYAATPILARSIDAETGTLIWTKTRAGTTGRISAIAVDAIGNVFVSAPNETGVAGYIYKLSPTGVELASFKYVDASSLGGYAPSEIAVRRSDGKVAAIAARASASYTGYVADEATVYILDNSLSLEKTLNTSSVEGAGIEPSVVWADDGELVMLHGVEASPTPHRVRKRNIDTDSDSWYFNTGANLSVRSSDLQKGVDGNIIVGCPTANTSWDGAAGNTASLWLLDESDGSVIWYAADAESSGVSSAHTTVDTTSTTPAQPRETALVVVSAGSVYTVQSGSVSTPTGGILALTDEPHRIAATPAYNSLFLVDGTNSVVYDFDSDLVKTWTAETAGTLPSGARLIALYRGRVVLSGVATDAGNWFMSKQGDPFDWDYAPATPTAQDAVAGNNSLAGEIGDVITALMPFNDDLMWFGCNGSIWQMTGDPLAGGAIDLISDQTGMSFGASWAKDPNNTMYFHGIDGIYRMVPNSVPESITNGRLDEVFRDLDRTLNRVKLTWNYLEKQLWVLISPLDGSSAATVYVYDVRTDSWWEDSYPTSMGPEVLLAYDAAVGNDEAFLLGCRDGYIRQQDRTATGDDGTAITSRARLEPILSGDLERMVRLTGASFGMAESSGDVAVRFYTAQTPEQLADSSTVRFKRTLSAGHNGPALPRLEAGAIGLDLYADALGSPWAIEDMAARTTQGGRLRRHRR